MDIFDTKRYIEECILGNVERLIDLRMEKLGYRHTELELELISLRTYFRCWLERNDSSFDEGKSFEMDRLLNVQDVVSEALYAAGRVNDDWAFDLVAPRLLETMQQLKPKIKEDCLGFLDIHFQGNFDNDKLSPFFRSISATLHGLLEWRADAISDVKVQIESLKDNTDLFCDVFDFMTAKWCNQVEEFEKFKIHFQALAWRTACLLLLYWVLDVQKENMAPGMAVILSDLHKESSPFTDPGVTRMYLVVLMNLSKRPAEIGFKAAKVAHKFVGFLKDNVRVDPEHHAIQMLYVELIFFITFLMDLQEVEELLEGEPILTQVNDLVNKVVPLISSLSSGQIKEGIDEERNFLLHNFLEKAKVFKAKVRKIYIHLFPSLSSFSFPIINMNVLRHIDSLLENLKGFAFSFPKLPIMILQKELLSFKESKFEDFSNLELQNKHKEIKYLWIRIVNMAHNAERAANCFMYMNFFWHDILHFSDVIEEFKLIKGEMKRIRDEHMYGIQAFSSEKIPETFLPLQINIPIADEVVGFKDEKKVIIDRLMGGSKELDIVSIVGMPGLGKTTLVKKVYDSVKNHFYRHAWCTVSQAFNNKRLFLEILRGIGDFHDDIYNKEEDDLAHRLYKSLKGERYLLVMDDIWDLKAWNVLKLSFPDDKVGSRIMFTSRICDLVLEAKRDCVPIPLKTLSKKESWELLEKKLFDQDRCPTDFVDFGMQIATRCKGLPLSIVLIAGILKKNSENRDWWKKIGEHQDILIADEDCMNTLELSYKHLPDFLKPCFLYFGSFPEDEEIEVKILMLLWISEGFIQNHANKSLETTAYEYFMDLVGRSLVTPTKKGSTGKIKTCRVHDLIHDFCFVKGEKENIFKIFHQNEVLYSSPSRVCIHNDYWRSFLESGIVSSSPFVSSLLPFPKDLPPRYSEYLSTQHIGCLACHFRFVQVLWLFTNVRVMEFPEAITELVLLKCLNIALVMGTIPPSIKKLQNLETFISEYELYRRIEFPLMVILEMQKLRHLCIRGRYEPTSFYDIDMPPSESLRTLLCAQLRLPYERLEMFFRKIPNVKNLKCQIESFKCTRESNLILKLDLLNNLESLTVRHYKTSLRFGYELHFPLTLKKLHLGRFHLPWGSMSAISTLPNLEVLKLEGGISGDTWNVVDEEFQNLKFLKLENLKIKELNASDNSFPRLECFVVQSCERLEEIPYKFGSILTLKMIHVDFHLENLARQIEEEQRDIGNELEVLTFPDQRTLFTIVDSSDVYSDGSE